MLGLRSDSQSILGGFDLFVLASAFGESCPTVLIEAMACGVRCVATDVGDSAQIIGDAGKIDPSEMPRPSPRPASRLLAGGSASSSAAARQRIQECYSIEIMTQALADLFEDLVSRRTDAENERASMKRAESAIEDKPAAAAS